MVTSDADPAVRASTLRAGDERRVQHALRLITATGWPVRLRSLAQHMGERRLVGSGVTRELHAGLHDLARLYETLAWRAMGRNALPFAAHPRASVGYQPPACWRKPGAAHGPGTKGVVTSRPFTETVIKPWAGGGPGGSETVPNSVHTIVTLAAESAIAGAVDVRVAAKDRAAMPAIVRFTTRLLLRLRSENLHSAHRTCRRHP